MIDRISNAAVVMAGVLAVVLTACGSNGKRADGDGKLVFLKLFYCIKEIVKGHNYGIIRPYRRGGVYYAANNSN